MIEKEATEPVQYAFIRDGLLIAGTLGDWARLWEGDYYAGEDDLSKDLLTWDGVGDPVRHIVRVTWESMNSDYKIPYTITVPSTDETVYVLIHGET